MSKGFKRVAKTDAKVIIFGTFPGSESLKYGTYDNPTYYAGSRNRFWQLIGYALDRPDIVNIDFEKRYDLLNCRGIGLWDIYDICEKKPGKEKSSKDSDIVKGKSKLNCFNDLKQFVELEYICFNGNNAAYYSNEFDFLNIDNLILPSSSNSCRYIKNPDNLSECIKLTDVKKKELWKTKINSMLKS
jgi:hypoxanthine-DNA glycosylase